VVHAGGAATGQRIVQRLSDLVASGTIRVLEGQRVTRILTGQGRAAGVQTKDGRHLAAQAVVLATGGAAAMWARTTNPPGATGGGLLLAHRAGAELADLELMQFHPTAVVGSNGADGFLVTEAVRGEGALLLDAAGQRFVDELAPRDEVARAVQRQMESTGKPSVGLDMRDIDPARFPNIVAALRRAGIDPARELVPVAPAAHYMMGGISTDLEGRATLAGLYAVGECACTGLHGANRLASNSLSECFVFGARAAHAAAAEVQGGSEPLPSADGGASTEPAIAPPPLASRQALWRYAGLERTAEGLRELARDPHPLVRLVAACALAREESRGAHQRSDFPLTDPEFDGRHVTLTEDAAPRLATWS
jgi:L-aspartate oxidase